MNRVKLRRVWLRRIVAPPIDIKSVVYLRPTLTRTWRDDVSAHVYRDLSAREASPKRHMSLYDSYIRIRSDIYASQTGLHQILPSEEVFDGGSPSNVGTRWKWVCTRWSYARTRANARAHAERASKHAHTTCVRACVRAFRVQLYGTPVGGFVQRLYVYGAETRTYKPCGYRRGIFDMSLF